MPKRSSYDVRIRETQWEGAACVGQDTNLFVSDNKGHKKKLDEYQAKKICKSCPLQMACADFALENHLTGVYGGYNDDERKALKIAKSILPRGRTRLRRAV
jgi:WhiB family redox-sensing transcriptional regulator